MIIFRGKWRRKVQNIIVLGIMMIITANVNSTARMKSLFLGSLNILNSHRIMDSITDDDLSNIPWLLTSLWETKRSSTKGRETRCQRHLLRFQVNLWLKREQEFRLKFIREGSKHNSLQRLNNITDEWKLCCWRIRDRDGKVADNGLFANKWQIPKVFYDVECLMNLFLNTQKLLTTSLIKGILRILLFLKMGICFSLEITVEAHKPTDWLWLQVMSWGTYQEEEGNFKRGERMASFVRNKLVIRGWKEGRMRE